MKHVLDSTNGLGGSVAQHNDMALQEDGIMKLWTPHMRDFVQQHISDDVTELLLSAHRYKEIDVPFAARQIEARRRLKDKLPEWFSNPDIVMGGRVPAEQCSSEETARLKRSIISGMSLCDLTGGMGVDFWYMSQGMHYAIYTERSAVLCEAARHNFAALSSDNVERVVRCGDGRDLPLPDVDVIYLDPARRATDGSRVYAIEDCEPNVAEWQGELREHAHTVLIKLSPMIDVTDMLKKMELVTDVYVVGVRNECKEILVKMRGSLHATSYGDLQNIDAAHGAVLRCADEIDGEDIETPTVMMHCIDFMSVTTITCEYPMLGQQPVTVTATGVGRYLYEPDVTLMKAQAFGVVCHRYDVSQLDYETHLMTSDTLVSDFPGRRFEVVESMPFTSRTLKRLHRSIPKANVAVRNFILTADQLKKRANIKDGGGIFLFGGKVMNLGDMLIICRKV